VAVSVDSAAVLQVAAERAAAGSVGRQTLWKRN